MSPLLFALVDALLSLLRREHWRMRAWDERREEWLRVRALVAWWRSAWPLGGES